VSAGTVAALEPVLSHRRTCRSRRVTDPASGVCATTRPAGMCGSGRPVASTCTASPAVPAIAVASASVRLTKSGTVTSRARSAMRIAAPANTR
jgi:hypothetical protein